jgi:thioredoxin 1
MKAPFLLTITLLSSVSLTSCWQKEEQPQISMAHAPATKNIVYLHQTITKSDDASSAFDRYIKSGNVVVDFYAEWCGPCKVMGRVIDQIAAQFPNVTFLKVDTDQFQSLASDIRGIPTLKFYKDGSQVNRFSGARDKSEFTTLLNQYFGR